MTNRSMDVEHIARAFPSPKDSRPARSLTYQWGGHTYRAVIGHQRRQCEDRAGRGPAIQPAQRVSGNTVLSIVATKSAIEIWSREPTRGWPNPCLIAHHAVLDIEYLDKPEPIAS
jgi:hypothetical protein